MVKQHKMSFLDSGTVLLIERYKCFSLLHELSCILMISMFSSFKTTDHLVIGVFCQ